MDQGSSASASAGQSSQAFRGQDSMAVRGYRIAIFLAVLTGLTIGQLEVLVDQPRAVPYDVERDERAVRRFYDTVNAVLAGGPGSALLDVAHADFTNHDFGRTTSENIDAFINSLLDLRDVSPGSSVDVLSVEPSEKFLVVETSVAGISPITLGDHLMERSANRASREFVRVSGGKVIQRWAESLSLGRVKALLQIDDIALAGDLAFVHLAKVEIAPGGRIALDQHLEAVIVVESGAGRLEGSASYGAGSGQSDTPRDTHVLPGAPVSVHRGLAFSVWQEGPLPLVLILATVAEPALSTQLNGLPTADLLHDDAHVTVHFDMKQLVAVPTRGVYQLEGWVVEANHGAAIDIQSLSGPSLVIALDGRLRIGVHAGPVGWRSAQSRTTLDRDTIDLLPGDEIVVKLSSIVTLRAWDDRPATFLFLAFATGT